MIKAAQQQHKMSRVCLPFLVLCVILGATTTTVAALADEQGVAGAGAVPEPWDLEWVDRPIPFLSKSQNLSEIVLEPEGLEFLRRIKTPVAVVTFIGMSRSGKSFSIDHLLGVDPRRGFRVGHTISPETRGAELWGRPINAQLLAARQNRTCVLVLDTEGLGASLSNYDKAILFFSMLMSSRVVYHLNENINNDDVTRLYSIINLVEMFKKEKIPTINLPYISWVVQRFTLGLPPGRSPVDVLFEKKLVELPNPSNDEGISHFNETVRVVRSEFKEHSAFFIPPASKNVDDFIRLPDMKPSELNAGYTKMMGELRDLILRTQPKRLGNTDEEMTGETLANFIVGLIPEVNKGTLYMGDRVVEGIAKGLLEKCKREYTRETQKIALPVEAAELETYSLAAKELSMRCFEDGMVGRADSYVKALYRTMLEDENQLTYDFLKENNTYHSMGLCAKVTKLTNEKTMKSERVGTAHDGYIDEVVAAAASMLRGPKKAQCLEDIRSNVVEILNNKKISLVPARIDVLIKNIITIGAVLYVFASYTKFRLMWSLVWLVGVLGVLLASYKFNFFSLLTRDQVVAILDTYDEACYIVATYWQALPFAAILLLLVAFLFRPRRPADAVRVLGARVKKECVAQDKADGSGSGNGIVCVQFWRNCTNNGKAVKEVARKITRKDKIIVLIGWRHYLGLSFLPRSRSAHIVCSGGADVNVDDVRDVFERAKGLIAGNTDDYDDDYENGSSRRSGKHRSGESTKPYIIYAYNVETSAFLLPPDREIKSELESSDIFSGSKSDQDSD